MAYYLKCLKCGIITEYSGDPPKDAHKEYAVSYSYVLGIMTLLGECYICKHPGIRYGENINEVNKDVK